MSPAPATKVSPNEKLSGVELGDSWLADVLVRVLTRPQTINAVGLSPNTWERMEKDGETPPITELSERRIGYRVVDVVEWLEARRQSQDEPATEAPLALFLARFLARLQVREPSKPPIRSNVPHEAVGRTRSTTAARAISSKKVEARAGP